MQSIACPRGLSHKKNLHEQREKMCDSPGAMSRSLRTNGTPHRIPCRLSSSLGSLLNREGRVKTVETPEGCTWIVCMDMSIYEYILIFKYIIYNDICYAVYFSCIQLTLDCLTRVTRLINCASTGHPPEVCESSTLLRRRQSQKLVPKVGGDRQT